MLKPYQLKAECSKVEDENWQFRSFLKTRPEKEVDHLFNGLHHQLFSEFDCTTCMNCCREYTPTFTEEDIKNASAYLKMGPDQFKNMYISKNQITFGEFQVVGNKCPFFKKKKCEIYDNRPKCCKEYPHTQKPEMSTRLIHLVQNCEICPVVFEIFEQAKKQYTKEFSDFKRNMPESLLSEDDFIDVIDEDDDFGSEDIYSEEYLNDPALTKWEKADRRIARGYDFLIESDEKSACDFWLEAWEIVKEIMAEENICNLREMSARYPWNDFLSNYVQELEQELHNAGISDKIYYEKRILFCKELLPMLNGEEDDLIMQNTRRAIAETYCWLGNIEETERLFTAWIEEDPAWGWGYIGWADCYTIGRLSNPFIDFEKAALILEKAMAQPGLRDRIDVLSRAVSVYKEIGNLEKVELLVNEAKALTEQSGYGAKASKWWRGASIDADGGAAKAAPKISRNDPCPCGSGKKYKKCCGR